MTDRPLIDDRPIVSCEEDGYHECEGDPCRTCEMIEGRTTDRPLIDEVREALEVGAAGWHNTGRRFGHDGVWTECDLRFCKADRDLLARLDGMTIVPAVRHTPNEVAGRCGIEGPHPRSECAMFAASVPAGEVERLDAFVESIGLSCCPHTQPASLREHVENEGWCVICREYVAHTDDTFRPVPWPCPPVRLTGEVERLREALRALADSAVLVPMAREDDDDGPAEFWCVHPDPLGEARSALGEAKVESCPLDGCERQAGHTGHCGPLADVPAGEVERLREALAMTGTEAVNLRVRVIEERAIAAERERIKREVDGHGRSTGMGHKSADWQDGHEEMRAAVFRIIDGEATDG